MMSVLQFCIDKPESDGTNTLAIRSSIPLSSASIGRLDRGKEAALFLYQQELLFQKKSGKRPKSPDNVFVHFHVAFSQTLAALKLLAASGLLQYNEKSIVCDFFGKSEFYYLIKTSPNNIITITGHLKINNKEFSIKECDFICGGPPHWYICGSILRFIHTEISWKDLCQIYIAPHEVSLKHIREAYQDSTPEEDSPKLIFIGERIEAVEVKPPQVLPLLVLNDRLGAFANLWMVYSLSPDSESVKVTFDDPSFWLKDAAGKALCRRDRAAEGMWERDLLETDFIKKTVGSTHFYCPIDKVAKSLTFLLEVGWEVHDTQGRRIFKQTASAISINSQNEEFIVQGKIRYGDHEADVQNVVGAFNRREHFVQLGIGAIGLLPEGGLGESLSMAMAEGEIVHDGIKIKRNRFGSLTAALETDKSINCDMEFNNLKERLLSFQGIEERLPGPAFAGALRPYQQAGLNWLAFLYEHHFHGLLADDMGLGKTVQVLAFISQIEDVSPILIVLPTSLLFNWKREIERFLPGIPILVQHGLGRSRDRMLLAEAKIVLTSYATLRLDLPLFESVSYECIILDEAQMIKNSETQTAQALYKLIGRFRLSISGTPVENHLGEMWAHFRFLMPDLFDSKQQFLSDVAAGTYDPRHLQKVRHKIMPFFLRRKKDEVAKDLPDRIDQVVWVEMSLEQRRLYEDFLAGFKGNLFKKVEVDGIAKHRMDVLEAILRLRQICCHPLLALPSSETALPSAKLEILLQDLETAISEGAKVLVYSQFTSMLSLIAKEVKARQWNYVYLDGSTRDRETVVRQFQEDPLVSIFLISLKAGGLGLNLTAADYVLLFDPWWNEAVENQAIDRAHRIGRKATVIAKRYISVESIEEKILRLKALKRASIDSIVDDDLGKLDFSMDDLRFLID